jgi:hypothetical protein
MKKLALISLATLLGMSVSQSIPNKQASSFLATPNSLPLVESFQMLSAGTEPLIGGGLHDIIMNQSLQTLERWALTAEAHHVKITGKKLIGGLHGRQNPLTKEEFTKYILDMAQSHPELNSAKQLDRLSLSYGIITDLSDDKQDSTKSEPLIGGGLHDILRTKSLEEVKTWALTAEAHLNTKTGKTIIGGIGGRQNPLSKEEYENYILDLAELYPELNSSRELNRLSLVYNISNPSLLQFGGLHDFLFRQDRETLEKWALTAEAHHNAKSGSVIIGGIHGRKNPLTNEEFANYIMDMSKIYPELTSASKLEELSFTYGVQNSPVAMQIGGLHDFIFRESRETLEKWANTAEAHHVKVTGKPLIGGLHGRRNPLTNEEFANYVLDMSKIYPGLNSRTELEKLSVVYGFSDGKISGKVGDARGGLHDYLFRQPRETLVRWALTAEEHLKQKTGTKLIGGLHGRLEPLNNQDYAQFIMDMAKKFPELDNGLELDRLSQVYGFADNPSLGKTIGGLHDYIFRTERNTLIRWALTAEAHDRKIKDVVIYGGLHDYIAHLSNENIAEYILRMADSHPELNSADALNNYSQTYGIHIEGGNDKKMLAFLA